MPGRNLIGIDRQQDGSSRVNDFIAFAGQGGSAGGQATSIDNDSITKYGAYVGQQFFPGLNGPDLVANVLAAGAYAEAQVALRASGKQTVTFTPAPERGPRPWLDYQLGDRVPVLASAQKFRELLGTEGAGSTFLEQYLRIYGWSAAIDDNALETITVLVSPQDGAT